MKLWKKLTSLLLILLMLITLSGCDLDAETAQNITEGILDVILSSEGSNALPEDAETSYDHSDVSTPKSQAPPEDEDKIAVVENGWYDDVESVAAYLVQFGRLPDNYLTKNEAQDLGWQSGEDLWDFAPGMSIGGSHFGNYEELLPEGSYREADIDYRGGSRNAKRIVYTAKGELVIYYTDDHYNSFTQVYPED